MEDDTLFIIQYNTATRQLKLTCIPNARQSSNFNFAAIQASQNDLIKFKSSFINPSQIISSTPLYYNLNKPVLITPVRYGYLYNWYAATDLKNIAANGWHVPTLSDFSKLIDFLGSFQVAAGKMKETGTVYWNDPNTGATNSSKFNARGAGGRHYATGAFSALKVNLNLWVSNSDTSFYYYYLSNNSSQLMLSSSSNSILKRFGRSIRLIKDSSSLSDGQTGIYTGNDGKIYHTICIGSQEWLASNLAETLFRDGSEIPTVSASSSWITLTSSAKCAYNNDENNV